MSVGNVSVSNGGARSAVFVDFDNVYSGLRDLDPRAAERFASDPTPWLMWIQGGMPGREDPRIGDLGERRVLVRRCYLNPVAFSKYRPFFTRAGFSVVDCPPLTAQGKTSTDIHMVMDILDSLREYEHITEYIVLSGDADFTPVLLRLRARDKRTVILPVGPAAAAYRAAADRVLAENDFVEVGLGLGGSPDPVADPGPDLGGMPAAEARSRDARAGEDDVGNESDVLRTRLIDEIHLIVASAPSPLALARVAHEFRAKFGAEIDETDWAGTGSFKGLLRGAGDIGLEITAGAGHIYDRKRHEPPVGAGPDPITAFGPALGSVVTRVSNVTGAPILTADQHAHVFRALQDHLRENPYDISATSKAVRDRCGEWGQRISRQAINFILKGIAYRHGFEPRAPKDADSLAVVYADNVLGLASAAQLVLSDEERALVTAWLTGGEEPD